MNIKDWLEAETGRQAAMAEAFKCTTAAISQWKSKGVPVERMKAVCEYTDGAVTLEEMVPESKVQAN